MKKNINCLVSLIFAVTIFNSAANNCFTITSAFTTDSNLYQQDGIKKSNDKFIGGKVKYQITNSNTDLITGLISKGGNTDGAPIIKTKNRDPSPTAPSLKIKINPERFDLKNSYYVAGGVDNFNNFKEKTGTKIEILSENFTINNNGIYYLHLANIYKNNDYNSYLELDASNRQLKFYDSKFDNENLELLSSKLNIKPWSISTLNGKVKASIWLHRYQFLADEAFAKSLKTNSKGFPITIENLKNGYRDFLDPLDYQNSETIYNINKEKLDKNITRIATNSLKNLRSKAENTVNMHGYSLQQILNGRLLPQVKSEIDNYDHGKSFAQWLQDTVNSKLYFWQLTIKVTSGSLMLLLLIITIAVYFYIKYRKIYQPMVLKEIILTKKQIKYFKRKKIISNVYQFIKLNSKINKHYFWKKYNFDSFSLVQAVFKNNLDNIDYRKYDNIFYHRKNKSFLLGKPFINIFLNSKDVIEYNKIIRTDYPNYFANKLHKIMLYDILNFCMNNIKNDAILAAESNFDVNTKMQLIKIRSFLKSQEWNYYFFDLQNLMHQTVINFLDWKDKSLNFNAYGKVLKRKLFSILQSEDEVEHYLQIIQTINGYRNVLSKVSSLKQNKLIEWNQLSNKAKEDVAWKIYFSLINFINLTNNYLKEEIKDNSSSGNTLC